MDRAAVRVRGLGRAAATPTRSGARRCTRGCSSRATGAWRISTCSPTRPGPRTGIDRQVCRDYLGDLDYALSYRHLAGLTDFFRRLAQDGLVPDGSALTLHQRSVALSMYRRIDRTASASSGTDPRALPEGRRCSSSADLADAERWRHHPDPVVTYIIDRNINYTNVCVADCGFCAFYRRPKARRRLRPELRADRRARSTSARRSAGCRSCCRAGTTRTSRSSGTSS